MTKRKCGEQVEVKRESDQRYFRNRTEDRGKL